MLNVYFEDFNYFNFEYLDLILFGFYIGFYFKLFGIILFFFTKKAEKWVSPHNPPIRDGPSQADILLAHTKVGQAGLAHF